MRYKNPTLGANLCDAKGKAATERFSGDTANQMPTTSPIHEEDAIEKGQAAQVEMPAADTGPTGKNLEDVDLDELGDGAHQKGGASARA
mmetsp:Transcript_15740/g.28303  ORF Transcript_15740/g.28303 Transcript_15740/m.28303 type:complete len:89 (+) Transcript_15740:224-490(+)